MRNKIFFFVSLIVSGTLLSCVNTSINLEEPSATTPKASPVYAFKQPPYCREETCIPLSQKVPATPF